MSSRRLKVRCQFEDGCGLEANGNRLVIARNALAQEESEEFTGDFQDPINIHLDNEQGGCAC